MTIKNKKGMKIKTYPVKILINGKRVTRRVTIPK